MATVTREREELIEELKRASMAVFAGFEYEVAKDLSRLYREAAAALAAPPASDPKDATHEYCPKCLMSGRLGAMTALRKDNGERYCLGCVERLQPLYPAAQAPPGLYRQGQEDMRRRVLDIVRDPSDCRIVKKLPIWGVPGMSEAAAAVAPLVERAQQATGGSDASDFRMRQSDPPGLVALLKEPHFLGWPKTAAAGEYAYSRDAVMVSAEWYERLKALALPASPQAKED